MAAIKKIKKLSFLIYGLGMTGKSVISFSIPMILKNIRFGMKKISRIKNKNNQFTENFKKLII